VVGVAENFSGAQGLYTIQEVTRET
jgi:hypothetical protein